MLLREGPAGRQKPFGSGGSKGSRRAAGKASSCAVSKQKKVTQQAQDPFATREVYRDSFLDKAAIWFVSSRMRKELGRKVEGKSFASGYDGFVELSNEIMKGKSSEEQRQVIRNILASLLPEQASDRFRRWFPLSKWAAETNAKITKVGFFWLVGHMDLEPLEVDFKGRKEVWQSAVKIKKCRYLEVSGCKAMCVNMCKRPTQEFFTEKFGLPLTMVPNFEDLSCEMKFGERPPRFEDDDVYLEPCFSSVCTIGDESTCRPCHKMDTERRT